MLPLLSVSNQTVRRICSYAGSRLATGRRLLRGMSPFDAGTTTASAIYPRAVDFDMLEKSAKSQKPNVRQDVLQPNPEPVIILSREPARGDLEGRRRLLLQDGEHLLDPASVMSAHPLGGAGEICQRRAVRGIGDCHAQSTICVQGVEVLVGWRRAS